MKRRSRVGLAVKGLLKFKHKSCFENNTVEEKKNLTRYLQALVVPYRLRGLGPY